MLDFMTILITLRENLQLMVFFISMVVLFGLITKDFKSAAKVLLIIALALSFAKLI